MTEPARVVAIVTREAVEELGLKPGMSAAGVVKATSVMVDAMMGRQLPLGVLGVLIGLAAAAGGTCDLRPRRRRL